MTDANELVAEIHDRMPVILAPEDYDRWLGRDALGPSPNADVAKHRQRECDWRLNDPRGTT
jgi:putative SOS response-associated peptidase YedK